VARTEAIKRDAQTLAQEISSAATGEELALKVLKGLTKETFWYKLMSFFTGNKQVLAGEGKAKTLIGTLDAALHWACRMKAEPAPEMMWVYRGLAKADLDQYIRTREWVWDAFTATSTDPNVAAQFAGPDGVVFRIRVPKGSPIVRMEAFSHHEAEREWGLEGGSSFRAGSKIVKEEFTVRETRPDGSTVEVPRVLPVLDAELTGNPLADHLAKGQDAAATTAAIASLGNHEDDDGDEGQ
jgi:hypothetical protein